jgi:hypothetical protein
MIVAYKVLVWTTLLGSIAVGSWIGWRFGTERLYRREEGSEVLGEANISPALLRRRKLRRLLWTSAGAGTGLVVGYMALVVLARFQT